MTFETLAGGTAVARGPTNLGLVADGSGGATLVDAGNDADAGRRLLKAVEAAGLRVDRLVLTHSNADHSGGAAFVRARTGCRVGATALEAAVIEHPFLEPSLLWGGYPPKALRTKFLMAEPCAVDDILDAPGTVPGTQVPGTQVPGTVSDTGPGMVPGTQVPGTELSLVPLPGHFLGMIGVFTPDRVLFCADTVASEAILDKYRIFYLRDIEAQLRTFDLLEAFEADWFVPSHAEPTRDIRPLVAYNRARVLETAELCLEACGEPSGPDEVLAFAARRHGLSMNHAQYALVGSTIRSYLAWLAEKGELRASFDSGRLLYGRA